MALTIEDGTNVANADSYITVAEYNTWADARFGSGRSTAPATDAAAEQLILRAMDYFEGLEFQGIKTYESQALQWPRAWVVIDGYAKESDEIPTEVKKALYELTYAEELGDGELNQVERKVQSETVGPISVTYSSGSASNTLNPGVTKAIRKLLKNGTGGSGFKVSRA